MIKTIQKNKKVIGTGKTLLLFCLQKKTWKYVFDINSELSQNHTEKQIMPLKTRVDRQWCQIFFSHCFF